MVPGRWYAVPDVVLNDFQKLIEECRLIRLHVNPKKCELFFCSDPMDSVIADFNELSPGIKIITEDLELLGAPLTELSTKKVLSK